MSHCVLILFAGLFIATAPAAASADGPAFGVSLYGAPKYGPASTHFDWANPDAPKGGTLKLEGFGTFDTLNPFIVKGVPPVAVVTYESAIGYLYEPLMMQSLDEPFAEYGLVAESIDVAPDRASATFQIRKEARFSDGSPITPDDVIWSFNTLTRPGMPLYHDYFANVVKAEKVSDRGVRFIFKDGNDRELPLIIGQLPVLSKAYWSTHDFDKTTLDPPVGNGPYQVESLDPGRSITFRRVKNWWGDKLTLTRGLYNFDRITIDYYRDDTVALEAFKAGAYDFRQEQSSKNWAIGYDSPALSAKQFLKEGLPEGNPQPMEGYVFNIRKDLFKDRRVRQALEYLFDFEWSNKTLFYNAYTRARSFWNNSELGSSGLPAGPELALLEKYRGHIPDEVFTTEFKPPVTDGSGNIRDGLREALHLFEAAGWSLKNNQLTNDKTGQVFEFDILLNNPAFERVTLPYIQNLQRIGIAAHLRTIDTSQYVNRVQNFDYDVIFGIWGQSPSPGNEQREMWSSAAADRPGSQNYIGLEDPVVDELVEQILNVKDYEQLKTVTHALDRVLLEGHYLVPGWYLSSQRVAYWSKLHHPALMPKYAPDFLDAWWMDPGKTDTAAAPQGR